MREQRFLGNGFKVWMAKALLGACIYSGSLVFAQAEESCGPAFNNVSAVGAGHFIVYDGLLYRGKPDLSVFGIQRISVIDRGIWPPGGDRTAPDPALVAQVAKTFPDNGSPVVFDFETIPLLGPDSEARDSIAKLNAIVGAFRTQRPDRRYGFYGILPIGNYWDAITQSPRNPKFRAWQANDDRLATLERNVDFLFPSLYTFYDDRESWRQFAIAQICEARRISKRPVIVFLWPEFHVSNKVVRDRFIEPDFWQFELEVAHRYADGIVLWGGYDLQNNHPRDWDESAAWWQRTKTFMQSTDR